MFSARRIRALRLPLSISALLLAANLLLLSRSKPTSSLTRKIVDETTLKNVSIVSTESESPKASAGHNSEKEPLQTANIRENIDNVLSTSLQPETKLDFSQQLIKNLTAIADFPPAECSRDEAGFLDFHDVTMTKRRVMCIPWWICSQSMGNCLARYYEARAFAHENALDFVMKQKQDTAEESSFLDEIPRTVVAESAYRGSEGTFRGDCVHACSQALFPRIWSRIKSDFSSALTTWFAKRNMQTPPKSDTVVYIRCGDILQYAHHSEYGFLSYSAYKAHVPPESKRITIIASPMKNPRRPTDELHKDECQTMYDDLRNWLHETFPQAEIELISTESVSQSVYRMVFSEVLICNPSTFCLWPAIAAQGKAFLPKTPLFLGGTTPFLGDHVQWRDLYFLSPTKYIQELGSNIQLAIANLRSH
jgi:hypothetical protein